MGVLVGLYVVLGFYLHWSRSDYALLLMPLYAGFISLVLVPLGVLSYISMARGGRNAGIIRIPHVQPRATGAEHRADADGRVETNQELVSASR